MSDATKLEIRGAVTYAYDAAGRRISMGVTGQTSESYSYDNANRLTQITQSSSSVSFTYDADSRRATLTLPNGAVATYAYDTASQLTGITYTKGGSTLGNLTYAYDLAGRRTIVGGSYAASGLPSAVSSTSYNANNQIGTFGSASLTYDLNGNLTSDGTNSYTWDARNHLVGISGGASASFQYDPFGRRVSKTVGGTTQYLYDGANVAQELAGGNIAANLLSGGVDEAFSRTDASGAGNFITDALGNTVALLNGSGTALASYTYEPFGKSTVTGTSTNPYQYTGRENDGTGLYFYRARYYSPSLQRFISEDPLRLHSGSINFYSYVDNSPSNFVDRFGTDKNKNNGCVEPTLLQQIGIPIQAVAANFWNTTIGLGVGGTVAGGNVIGAAFTYSTQIVVSPNGQAAYVTTSSDASALPFNAIVSPGVGAYGGFQYSFSNARTPQDLGGKALDFGGGAGSGLAIGGDVSFGSGTQGQPIVTGTVTVGGGAGSAGYGLSPTITSVTPICSQ